MSFEQVELMAAANIRRRARLVLELSQAIASSWDKDAWSRAQRRLLRQAETGM